MRHLTCRCIKRKVFIIRANEINKDSQVCENEGSVPAEDSGHQSTDDPRTKYSRDSSEVSVVKTGIYGSNVQDTDGTFSDLSESEEEVEVPDLSQSGA